MNKKICFFTNSMFKIGGEQRITSLIANELVKNNYDVTIIIKSKEEIDYSLYNLSKKIHLIFLNVNFKFNLNNIVFFNKLRIINRKYGLFKNNKRIIRHFFCSNKMIKELKDIFNNNHYDVVIGVAGDKSFTLSYIKKYINSKLIYWNHMDFDAHYINKGSRYYNEESFIKPLLYNFDEIINLNEDDVYKFKKYYDLDTKVIHNCKSFISKNKTKLNNHKFISCGRLVEQKGFNHLIEVMNYFVKENKDYILDIYGDGPLKEELQNKINEYDLKYYIRIKEPTKNIEKEYLNYDVYLSSSIHEGFGLTIMEALECGLPVYGFDIPANNIQIINNKTGRIIECYNVEKYAKVLFEDIKENKLKYYQSNIAESIKEFNIENIIKKWIDIL